MPVYEMHHQNALYVDTKKHNTTPENETRKKS